MKAAAFLGLAIGAAASPFGIGSIKEAPVLQSVNAKHIPNSYIVKFKDHVKAHAAAAHHSWVNDLHVQTESRKLELRKRSSMPFVDDVMEGMKHTYNIAGAFMGYSGHFDDAVLEQLRRHPDVSDSPHPNTSYHNIPVTGHATLRHGHGNHHTTHLTYFRNAY